MQTPTPETTRRTTRRADRYRQESGVAPSPQLIERTSAPAPAPLTDAPPAMARPRPAPPRRETPRMPLWLTASIIAGLILILALVAAQNMMQAYITQQRTAREAAYQRIVDAHPLYFTDVIEHYANENNLQPAFVAAIILNESSFRTNAESSVGARGLMQLMPDTAEWIAGKLDADDYYFDQMYDAEQNIRFGTWYLSYLCQLFRGDPVAVACAYHAGQNEVRSWLSDRSISPDGMHIDPERIPIRETKTYAGRVTQAYAIYDALFYHPVPAPDADPAAGAV